MIGLVSYLLVYVLVPFAAYHVVARFTGSKETGVFAGILSIVAAIVLLEGMIRRLGRRT